MRAAIDSIRQPTARVALRRHFPLGFAEYQGRINELQNPVKNNVLSKSKNFQIIFNKFHIKGEIKFLFF